ncbi:BlaI/MecI/CopY family transcriptional regulator [Sphingoaurantiacus capsulatus]|uniref:BlaI/MecI/CopY family transcriptional regulator n=1 Tax=Sphingoaurantiacus capsulatus TaxID=1771310 RepID=A0ABV7X7S7_9SPHN
MIGNLPRRERELFEILCSVGEATAADLRERMVDPPSYSAVRTMMTRLAAKGLVRHRVVDQAYVYRSAPQAAQVKESALHQMVKNFFDGSAVSAATALVGLSRNIETDELDALQRAIDEARERRK